MGMIVIRLILGFYTNMSNSCHHPEGSHHHHHHHDHSHDHSKAYKNLRLAFSLNLFFAFIELIGGLWTNSFAIVSDALHDFGDAMAIGVAWWMEKKSEKTSDHHYSYGYRRMSVLAAFLTAVILILGSLFIISEAVTRIFNPEPVKALEMIPFALLGIAVNGFAAWKVSSGHSMNEQMISWHLIEDLIGWLVVLLGAVLIYFFNLPILDSLLAIGLSCWVLYNVVRNTKKVLKVFLQAVPDHLSVEQVRQSILEISNVSDVHHCHLWTLDGEKHIWTCHVVTKPNVTELNVIDIKRNIKNNLKDKYGIIECTIEIEKSAEDCVDPAHG